MPGPVRCALHLLSQPEIAARPRGERDGRCHQLEESENAAIGDARPFRYMPCIAQRTSSRIFDRKLVYARGVHVLIATTGVLPPGPVADLTLRLAGTAGHVSVLTVVPAPQEFLDTLELELWHPLTEFPHGAESEQARTARYVEERGERLAAPVVAALIARSMVPEKLFLEGSDPAKVICRTADSIGADLVLLGVTRRLFSDGAWRSVSTEVMEQTHVPVILVPPTEHEDGPRS
ncbi:universal stress protein family protein [bacterium BMS3Bbin01]|nr:universal stress protein family protein [bacterium BMS3Bbin01]